MAAYIIFTREKTLDPSELEIYKEKNSATFVGHQAKHLTNPNQFEVLEGAPTQRVVMLEFPTMAAAKAWYESPAYQEASEHRLKGGVYRCILVDGAE